MAQPMGTAGGAFVPSADYNPTGNWTFAGDVTVQGTLTDTGTALASPVITGTVTGNAAYTAITITTSLVPTTSDAAALGSTTKQFSDLFLAEGGVINWDNGDATLTQAGDVVTLAGAVLATSTVGTAANSVATIDGSQTLTNKTLTSPVLGSTVTGTYTLGGTPTLASAAGVPYVGGVAAGYKLARSATVAAVTGTLDIDTGLAAVLAVAVTASSDLDGDTLAGVSGLITGSAGHFTAKCWKVTTGGAAGNPTLIAANAAKNVHWVAIGT